MVKSSEIDFDYFIGQAVTDVNTKENSTFIIFFENGRLMIECPWRIRKNKEIVLGETDLISDSKKFSLKNAKNILLSKRILNISFYEDLLFIIEFEDNLSLELFHASCYFEGWTLQGENGLDIWTLPGGKVCY
ncbi:hypothetical protein [Fictibacillus barbaricus]|nr:hypothetical protein [Fictibacillus barbaricus]GGB52988.1 hypothetical protein GCM10007199_18590 [Fictibacillus barbaricus]